jgi:hypothetical protein
LVDRFDVSNVKAVNLFVYKCRLYEYNRFHKSNTKETTLLVNM